MSPRASRKEGTQVLEKAATKTAPPSLWRVVLLNDDYTTQDFVVWVLQTVFRKSHAEAFRVMISVHKAGRGIAGVYTHDVARTKVQQVKEAAETEGHPLLCVMEPDSGA